MKELSADELLEEFIKITRYLIIDINISEQNKQS